MTRTRTPDELDQLPDDTLVGTLEIASLLGVSGRTVARWSADGSLGTGSATLGGHRRHYLGIVRDLRDELKAAPE